MDLAGIDKVILSCPVPVGSDKVRAINELMAGERNKCPNRYRALASLPFDDVDRAIEEVRYALDVLKLDGFILSSNNDSVYISDDSLDPLFDELNRRKATVFLHPSPRRARGYDVRLTGADDSAYEYTFETTRAMLDYIYKDKYLRNPDITWVLSHGGGTIPYLAYRASNACKWHAARQDEETILRQLKSLYYDLALVNDPLIYRFLKEFCGVDHLVFGSDYPAHKANHIREDREMFLNTDVFNDEEKERIGSLNAERLFGRGK
ncbi:MAG: amidohydrolase [Erysipelotrichaceae bacterium]|nr:amidohydrolase [Erysipelotrichaceae bacterium]